jgi:hypothetical protein
MVTSRQHHYGRRAPQRSGRDWCDYAMLALAFAVLLVGVLGLLR